MFHKPFFSKKRFVNLPKRASAKRWVFLLIIILSGILQVTLLNNVRFFYVIPDLLLICAVLAGLIFDLEWALIFGVLAGIFKDSFCAAPFGINTALFPLWCFLIIELAKRIDLDFDLIKVGLLFIVSLLHNIIAGLSLAYAGDFIPPGIFARNVLIGAVYTSLFLPLVFEITNPIYTQPSPP